ncbi:cfaD, partial [Symbiodinium sp. KB8]
TGVVLESYTNVTMNDETALMQAIAEKGPISVSIDASLQSFSYYGSGVFYDPECKNGVNDLDHSVLAVGYGTENGEDYWLIKNSWSTHWVSAIAPSHAVQLILGDNGYVKISRKNNNCGVATQPTFATLK